MPKILISLLGFLCFQGQQQQLMISQKISSTPTTSRVFNGTTAALSNVTVYLSGATTFTFAFWMKSANVAQTNTYLWADSAGNGVIYGFADDGSGHAQVEFFEGSGRTGSQVTILDTNWHHVAYRYNGTVWDKFLDGSKTTINASISFAMAAPSTPTTWASSGSANFYSGSLARFYISSAALTDGQISALAGATCSSSGVSGTIGYWLLGTASPDPESSPSPNTNSLTVTNATSSTGPTCSSQ